MKPLGWKNQISAIPGQNKISLHYVGWKIRKYPAVGEAFFLTSPFIELIRHWARLIALCSFQRLRTDVSGEALNARKSPSCAAVHLSLDSSKSCRRIVQNSAATFHISVYAE
jgi:hypothetical protein